MHREADQEFRLVRGGRPATTAPHPATDRRPVRPTHLRSVDPAPEPPGDEPVQLTALP